MPGILRRKQSHRDTHRGEAHVTTKAETGVMHLQGKECQGWLAMARSWGGSGKASWTRAFAERMVLPAP